jgi:Xaa-Pro aminopeptidase
MKKLLIFLVLFSLQIQAQRILSEKEQSKVVNEILADRLNNLLPKLMDRTEIDMWILISREYNEDPVLKTILPSTWLNARRRTIILFYRDKEKNTIEKLAVARYNFGENIFSAWNKDEEPNQWKRLIELIEQRNPKAIGLNFSADFNISDGLDKTDYDEFIQYLPNKYHNKVVSAEKLANSWIETRTEREMIIYSQLVDITHDIIAEAFSEKVITPGITSTTDVEWWFRQKVTDLGLKTWFHPSVDIQRTNNNLGSHIYSFDNRPEKMIILPGDLLHCDFGITYLRLNTDCQENAYVLKPKEKVPPNFLQNALAQGNKLQDIFTSNFEKGKTGNQILLKSLKEAKLQGLQPSIYTHPLGYYGHSSGPTIGMWDAQDGVSGAGDYPLYYNTVYAIELNTTVTIPEWDREIRVMLEEDGFYGENGFRYVNGRQTKLLTIPRIKDEQGN